MQVDVGDSDIDNVAIQLQPGADVAGRLRIEGANDLSALAQNNVWYGCFRKTWASLWAPRERLALATMALSL